MRSFLALLSCLCLVLVLAPGAEAAKRGKKCRSGQSSTVHKSRTVRLYETDGVDGSRLWGCLRRSGKKRFLTRSTDKGTDSSQTYTDVLLSGYYVAWSFNKTDLSCTTACPPGYKGQSFSIRLYNLRTKKSRRIPVLNTPLDKVLTRRGGLAWIDRSEVDGELEVVARDKDGQRVLAHGKDIGGLSLKGYTVSWGDDGVRRSAKLR